MKKLLLLILLSLFFITCKKDKDKSINVTVCVTNDFYVPGVNVQHAFDISIYIMTDTTIGPVLVGNNILYNSTSCVEIKSDEEKISSNNNNWHSYFKDKIVEGKYKYISGDVGGNYPNSPSGYCYLYNDQTTNITLK